MKQGEVKRFIASNKFNQYVALKSLNGIDYLQIGPNASAIASWQAAYDTIAALVVVPEPPAEVVLTREQLDSLTDEELMAK